MSVRDESELSLVARSTRTFRILVVSDNGLPESFAAVNAATFSIRESLSSTTDVLLFRTADSNISINAGQSSLDCTPSAAQMDAVTPGVYIGQFALRFSGGDWEDSEPFRVRIGAGFAPHTFV